MDTVTTFRDWMRRKHPDIRLEQVTAIQGELARIEYYLPEGMDNFQFADILTQFDQEAGLDDDDTAAVEQHPCVHEVPTQVRSDL